MPPGTGGDGEARGGAADGRGMTLSLPDRRRRRRGGAGGGGVGGANGSPAGGRSLPVRLPSTERSRRIKNTATSPIRMMS